MIVLDTNVVSELIRANPEERVVNWVSAQVGSDLFLTAISEAELLYGIEVLPIGRRRDRLAAETEGMLPARLCRPDPSIRQPGCPCFRRYLRQ